MYNTAVIPVEEALERILSRVGVLGDEQVPCGARFTGCSPSRLVASSIVPPWPNSSMDGYALRAPTLERVGDHARPSCHRGTGGGRARRPSVALRPGEAFRIFTGGTLCRRARTASFPRKT